MKNYMFLYKDIEFSHIFSANIVKTHFVIKMPPLVASEVRKYSPHTCEIHLDLSTCSGRYVWYKEKQRIKALFGNILVIDYAQ